MNWQRVALGPYLKDGPWLAIWLYLVVQCSANHMNCQTNEWQQVSSQGDLILYRYSHQGVIFSAGAIVGCPYELLSQWMATVWSRADFTTISESSYLVAQAPGASVGCPYELLSQWMATVWSRADFTTISESNYLVAQAPANHMSCWTSEWQQYGLWLTLQLSVSPIFWGGWSPSLWARFATINQI